MGFSLNAVRNRREEHLAAHVSQQDAEVDHEKSQFAAEHTSSGSDSDGLSMEERNEKEVQLHPNTVTADAQLGQQKAEATALVWGKKALYSTYAWIWLCFFMLAFQQAILNQATAAAYTDFATAPAVFTANILSVVIAGVLKLPIAKILVVWGRAEGFVIFFGVYLLGMIVLASCNGPNGYAAGYVLYWIGYDALYLIMDIFVADSSGLRNRAFCWAFVSTPFIITAFTAPLAANSLFPVTNIDNWRWGIGLFCIVQPVVFLPLAIVFKFYQKKAEKLGLYRREPSGRTAFQSTKHYFHEFDSEYRKAQPQYT
nr:siderophore iron transporter mirb [Quercus suber]